jgi:HemY protein
MRALFWFLLLLLLGLGLALVLREDNGYVLLSWGGWAVETSLAMFGLLLLLALTVLLWLFRVLRGSWRLPRRLRQRWHHWRRERARKTLTQGLVDLAEGRWLVAERRLARHAGESDTPLVNYLIAARAAQLQGAHHRRDAHLKNAYEQTPSATVAVLLTQAELQLAHRQYEYALATLRRLLELAPGQGFGLRLLARAYEAVRDWRGLSELLPELRQRAALEPDDLARLERECLVRLLEAAPARGGVEAVREAWNTVPRRLRRDDKLRASHVRALLAAGDHEAAEQAIEQVMRQDWCPELVLLYGNLDRGDVARRLSHAERWLRQRAGDADLLLTLARLCIHNQLWGKAREYLDRSLKQERRPDSYEELGRLLEHIGEPAQAVAAYRQGLELTIKRTGEAKGAHTPAVPRASGLARAG